MIPISSMPDISGKLLNVWTGPLALRPREAAKALSISERHLWQLTHDGKIPCIRVGNGKRKTVLYPVESLQAWLSSQISESEGGNNDAV